VTSKVIFDEIYYEGCTSHVLKDNFRIDGLEVNVLVLQIKVANQIFKYFSNTKIGSIVRKN
jgi:hypothetical protein